MEKIRRVELSSGWTLRNDKSKAKIFSQLKGYVDEMRDLPPPGPMVSNMDGGSLQNPRINIKNYG